MGISWLPERRLLYYRFSSFATEMHPYFQDLGIDQGEIEPCDSPLVTVFNPRSENPTGIEPQINKAEAYCYAEKQADKQAIIQDHESRQGKPDTSNQWPCGAVR